MGDAGGVSVSSTGDAWGTVPATGTVQEDETMLDIIVKLIMNWSTGK